MTLIQTRFVCLILNIAAAALNLNTMRQEKKLKQNLVQGFLNGIIHITATARLRGAGPRNAASSFEHARLDEI
jgi:hypothetical protein